MRKDGKIEIKIVDQDFPRIHDVDSKLIALAREAHGMVLPGEVLHLHIMREGKEQGQGVAYLDDGTMVVVENASRYLGQDVDASVTSILQTTAGRMIFTTLKEEAGHRRQ